jgi:hypothetical protein
MRPRSFALRRSYCSAELINLFLGGGDTLADGFKARGLRLSLLEHLTGRRCVILPAKTTGVSRAVQ